MNLKRKIKYFVGYVAFNKRLLNLILIKSSKFLKLTKVKGLPLTLMIEPTNICNLKCPLCPTGAGLLKRKKGHLSFQNFKKIIDELGNHIIHLRLWNWGEPLLNKDLTKMIEYAKQKKIFINTSTNVSFLNKNIIEGLISSGLDEIIISLDGATEQTYNKYRKHGDFKKAIESINLLVKEKQKTNSKIPFINLQFIVMKYNEHEIEKIKQLAKNLNVDTLTFKTVGIMDVYSKEDIKKYLPANKNFLRYTRTGPELKHKQKIRNKCDMLWQEATINWDGSVVPCCNDAHNNFVFGNIFAQSFKTIWNNQKYINFRKQILKDKNKINICNNCSGNNKNTLVKQL